MVEFKSFSVKDAPILRRYLFDEGEFTCEASFTTLFLWQKFYDTKYALLDGALIIRWGDFETNVYSLPYGDITLALKAVAEYEGVKYPAFWSQEGARLEQFKAQFGEHYDFIEERDSFDYIYLSSNLRNLSGKRYHSKRNHISAFSKKFDWHYEPITATNTDAVLKCAEKWYKEKGEDISRQMLCEKQGIECILSNMDAFGAKGGAIVVDGQVVAFTLGSPVNSSVFDMHIEKALSDYATAYAVINNEFAKRELEGYKYINREDDVGVEGLRRAKLSYHPEILLKKYRCVPKG